MSHFRHLEVYLFSALSCALLLAGEVRPDPAEAGAALQRLLDRRAELGLGPDDGLRIKSTSADPDGALHVRCQQLYRGLRVWGGEAILHLDPQGRELPMTDALVRGIRLEVTPNLEQAEALAISNDREAPRGDYTRAPTAELVVYPPARLQPAAGAGGERNARDFAPQVTGLHLAYHVHLDLQNGAPETRNDDYLVDAHTGAVLRKWSTLFTAKPRGKPATTMGDSQYSGRVELGSLSTTSGFVMADPTRATISTRDLAGATEGHGTLYTSPDGRWGDGENYDPSRGTKSANGQTAAVDAHYGLQTTWDFYRNVLGRDGVDGRGRTVYNRVHYARGFDNAFWDDDCFCMTYGDGEAFKSLTPLDVVAHEVSHGLCHATADLDYQGESGGLNESSSDIFGVMVQLYGHVAHGNGARLPAQGARWTMGADLTATPLRYMYKPSLDGSSPDAWSPDLDDLDVHQSSGPMNRAFYFLSQGASPSRKDDSHSKYLPRGMRGIGNDKALRIWWRALSTYLTPESRYADARRGAIRAAKDLYGDGSEARAVRLAFHGINVDGRSSVHD